MIKVTQEEFDKVENLVKHFGTKGRTLHTKIIYQLWPQLFGVKKRPNGCGACLRTDARTFIEAWKKLDAADIHIT